VYAWLLSGCAGDPEARKKLEDQIYAPAQGIDSLNEQFWAVINEPDPEG